MTLTHTLGLCALALVAWLWSFALAQRQVALEGCRRACREVNVQLLDDSVALARIDFARQEGRRRLRCWYDFEFSVTGVERLRGSAVVRDGRLEALRLDHPEGVMWVHPGAAAADADA